MRAISLWQPWASAMAFGHKTIETRSWSTDYRGPLAIHAAKRWTGEERRLSACFAEWFGAPELLTPPRGCIVAVLELYGCESTESLETIATKEQLLGDYGEGRFAWRTRNLLKLPDPIAYRGAQGFFRVPDSLLNEAIGR
ncbi:ASCH domain-containing protein [Sphingomonas sp. BK580]|uniref:ASCH domain-containing protein n=1 Tax=Sphingomonas sp. BK580 TaxID=2586972 RepID=UPI001619EB1B|nr:ASCH domain-containing protein [Sphingomonas sp. BK580]MBB3691486.1 hypothetical protein [Sphingomonas sp. BK580]